MEAEIESEESLEEEENINFDSLSIEKRASLLQKYLPLLSDENSTSHEIYYQLFPEDFQDFCKIFGYYGTIDEYGLPKHSGILSSSSEKYIEPFFNVLNVSRGELIHRVIDIAYQSEWQADAVNVFQHHVEYFVQNNLELVVRKLADRDKDVIEDFWYFLYCGPHPESKTNSYSRLKEKVKVMNPSLAEVMAESFKKLVR